MANRAKLVVSLTLAVVVLLCFAVPAMAYSTDTVYSAYVAGNAVYCDAEIRSGSTVAVAVYDGDGRCKEVSFRDDILSYAYLKSVTLWLDAAPERTDTVKVFIFDSALRPIGKAVEAERLSLRSTTRTAMAENARDNYFDFMAFSCDGLIGQLMFDGYSYQEAAYAAHTYSGNWETQAAIAAYLYRETASIRKRSEMINQLLFDGFTMWQAEVGYEAHLNL